MTQRTDLYRIDDLRRLASTEPEPRLRQQYQEMLTKATGGGDIAKAGAGDTKEAANIMLRSTKEVDDLERKLGKRVLPGEYRDAIKAGGSVEFSVSNAVAQNGQTRDGDLFHYNIRALDKSGKELNEDSGTISRKFLTDAGIKVTGKPWPRKAEQPAGIAKGDGDKVLWSKPNPQDDDPAQDERIVLYSGSRMKTGKDAVVMETSQGLTDWPMYDPKAKRVALDFPERFTPEAKAEAARIMGEMFARDPNSVAAYGKAQQGGDLRKAGAIKVGDKVQYRLFNKPEGKSYGDVQTAEIIALTERNGETLYQVTGPGGGTLDLHRREIKRVVKSAGADDLRKFDNPSCDGQGDGTSCRGEVRRLPIGGSGNLMLCRAHFQKEVRTYPDDKPDWNSLTVVADSKGNPTEKAALARLRKGSEMADLAQRLSSYASGGDFLQQVSSRLFYSKNWPEITQDMLRGALAELRPGRGASDEEAAEMEQLAADLTEAWPHISGYFKASGSTLRKFMTVDDAIAEAKRRGGRNGSYFVVSNPGVPNDSHEKYSLAMAYQLTEEKRNSAVAVIEPKYDPQDIADGVNNPRPTGFNVTRRKSLRPAGLRKNFLYANQRAKRDLVMALNQRASRGLGISASQDAIWSALQTLNVASVDELNALPDETVAQALTDAGAGGAPGFGTAKMDKSIRHGLRKGGNVPTFSFAELGPKAKQRAIRDAREFLAMDLDAMNEGADVMLTEDDLDDAYVTEFIEANEYEFLGNGDLVGDMHYTTKAARAWLRKTLHKGLIDESRKADKYLKAALQQISQAEQSLSGNPQLAEAMNKLHKGRGILIECRQAVAAVLEQTKKPAPAAPAEDEALA